MRAAQIKQFGGPEVIEIVDIDKPKVSEDKILIEISAASINPFDYKIRSGMISWLTINFPITLGGDLAGKVVEVGPNVSEFKVGDEVFGTAGIAGGGSGSFADFALTKSDALALKPKSLNFEESASLVLTGASAIQALEEHIKLQKDQKILIQGGAGGIGTVAVQLSKHLGAYVAATCATEDVEYVKSLGADEVIDYKTEKFEEKLSDFDAVFDLVGGEVTDKSFQVLKKGGVVVSMVGQPNEDLAKQYEVTAIGQGTKTNSEHLKRLAELVDSGVIKPHIEKEFTLDQTKEAFEYQESNHPKGKVVIKVKN